MPMPHPAKFRNDVIAVAGQGGSTAQIAKDFGITESCLRRWLAADYVAGGVKTGVTKQESVELRELKRRNRQLEKKTRSCAVRRRTSPRRSPQMTYPLVSDLAAGRDPRCGDPPGARSGKRPGPRVARQPRPTRLPRPRQEPAVAHGYRAPRGALEPCGGGRAPFLARRCGLR